ncbi:MAG: flagellar biosynthesis anti-sigma factor FlgM [Desulfatiglandaceae bacterium]|jgi:flagellar biosynthesis anti-sigma factor FlgM
MKIDEISRNIGLISRPSESTSGSRAANDERNVTHGTVGHKAGEKIDLSETSVEYNRVSEAAEREQTDRIERVNQLRDKVSSGQYHVDSSRVAEKMVREGLLEALKS